MRELIKEIEGKINTKEDLLFFIEEIDLARDLILKNIKKSVSEILKEKINPVLFSALEKIEKEKERLEKEKFEKEKKELSEKEREINEKLNQILEKEKKLENEVKKIELEEERVKGTEKEKETEKKRWEMEKERIKIEQEKWELKDALQKIKRDLKKIKPTKKERDISQLLFFLEMLREELISLPEVELEIAFFPPSKIIAKISEWFEKNLDKKVILNFKINPKIVGGTILGYRGKVRDFSLMKEIKKELRK